MTSPAIRLTLTEQIAADASQSAEVTEVYDGNFDLAGWAFLSDGEHEPAGTPVAAKFTGDECVYSRHESIDAALAHIGG